MLNCQHMLDGMIPKHHQDLFATPAFTAQGLSAMLVSPGNGSCRHHRFARTLARCHSKQWVPGRLIGLGVRSFRLKIVQQNPFLLWIVKNNGFVIIKYLWFVNFKYIFKKKIIKLRKTFFQLIYTFSRVDPTGRDMKKISRPLYHVHFTVIHTNSRHNTMIRHFLWSTTIELVLFGCLFICIGVVLCHNALFSTVFTIAAKILTLAKLIQLFLLISGHERNPVASGPFY